MSDVRKTLKEMAELAIFSNRISETQEKNLKLFPFIFFNNVESVTIDYDLGHGVNEETKEINHSSKVSYHLVLNEKDNDQLVIRFEAIERAVRQLFWKDIIVSVFFNDKQVYVSKNV